MKENIQMAVDFAEKIKGIKGILQIALFGSVATGEDKINSDIDITIIHNRKDKFNLIKEVNIDKPEKVQTTFIDVRTFPSETELVGALSGEGMLLYGSPIDIRADKLKLKSRILIGYSLAKLRQTEKVKLNRALYGSISKSSSGNKVYTTKSEGLIKEPGIEKVSDGVLIVERRKSKKVLNLLKRFKADFKETAIWTY